MSNDDPADEPQEALLEKIEEAADSAESQGEMVATEGELSLDKESLWLDNQHKWLALQDYEQDIAARKEFANKLFWLIVLWLIGAYSLLLMSGIGDYNYFRLELPENVLLAVIGGTTASILGLLYVVVKYLFPKR